MHSVRCFLATHVLVASLVLSILVSIHFGQGLFLAYSGYATGDLSGHHTLLFVAFVFALCGWRYYRVAGWIRDSYRFYLKA